LRGIPVLGIFGGKDDSAAEFVKLEKAAKENGVPFTQYTYPACDHAFLNEQRPEVYRSADAKDAWGKVMPFLKSNVR